MPALDKPLAELNTYLGSSPCPEDIDTFWDDALAEMHALDPQVELVPADFSAPNVECFHLYFTGVRGARIHAKYVRPTLPQAPHPAVVEFHGYSANSGDWISKLPWALAGYSIASLDCRGQGGLSEDSGQVTGNTLNGHIIRGLDDSPDKLLFRQIFLDTAQLARIVMQLDEVDARRVGAFGGSQGGGLTLACAALEPTINRAAATYPFLCDYKRIWDMDLDQKAYLELRDYFRRFDPTHENEAETFRKLGYIDVQNLAKRIRGKVLFGCGLIDDICPPSSQFAAYNKITTDKDMVIYPDFGHENLPGFNDRVFQFMMEMQ